MKGYFIALEGGEFSGKTTQVKRLAEVLKQKGFEVVITREPGGSSKGAELRQRLLHEKLPLEKELELFLEDRQLHIEEVILPALEGGKVVVTDRFSPSTIAYQGAGRGLGEAYVWEKDAAVRSQAAFRKRWRDLGNTNYGIWPHKIILLDGDPRKLSERAEDRGEKLTVFEELGIEFHSRVRASFINQAYADPECWCIVNALLTKEAVLRSIMDCIPALFEE